MRKKCRVLVGFSLLLLLFLQFFNPSFSCVISEFQHWLARASPQTHPQLFLSKCWIGGAQKLTAELWDTALEGMILLHAFLNVLLAFIKLIVTSVMNGPTLQWTSLTINILISCCMWKFLFLKFPHGRRIFKHNGGKHTILSLSFFLKLFSFLLNLL